MHFSLSKPFKKKEKNILSQHFSATMNLMYNIHFALHQISLHFVPVSFTSIK